MAEMMTDPVDLLQSEIVRCLREKADAEILVRLIQQRLEALEFAVSVVARAAVKPR